MIKNIFGVFLWSLIIDQWWKQKPSPELQCLHFGIILQNIALIGEKCIYERQLSMFKNVTNLQLVFWRGLTNMGSKMASSCLSTIRERQSRGLTSGIRNFWPKCPSSKKSFQVAGSPCWMCGGGKSLDCEKSWNRIKKLADWGLKSRQSMTHKYDTMWTRVMKAFPKTSSSRSSKCPFLIVSGSKSIDITCKYQRRTTWKVEWEWQKKIKRVNKDVVFIDLRRWWHSAVEVICYLTVIDFKPR